MCIRDSHYLEHVFVGNPSLKFQNLEDNKFQIEILLKKNSQKLKSLFSYFIVEEIVTDRRGTSRITHTSKLYKSENKKIKNLKSSNQLIFDFPKPDIPASTLIEDVEIRWTLYFIITLKFGLEFFYTKKMEVIKR